MTTKTQKLELIKQYVDNRIKLIDDKIQTLIESGTTRGLEIVLEEPDRARLGSLMTEISTLQQIRRMC